MVCKNCGTECGENTGFCATCGADLTEQTVQVQPTVLSHQPYPPNYQQSLPLAFSIIPGKGLAVASMVFGIFSFVFFPAITGTLAIIFGCVAKSKGYRIGMETAGIVFGIVGLVSWLTIWLLLFFMPNVLVDIVRTMLWIYFF